MAKYVIFDCDGTLIDSEILANPLDDQTPRMATARTGETKPLWNENGRLNATTLLTQRDSVALCKTEIGDVVPNPFAIPITKMLSELRRVPKGNVLCSCPGLLNRSPRALLKKRNHLTIVKKPSLQNLPEVLIVLTLRHLS
jgi:hypothetical protein